LGLKIEIYMAHRLSDFSSVSGMNLVRDGDFLATGKLSTPCKGLCVPLGSDKYIDEVNANPNISAVITKKAYVDGIDKRMAVAFAEKPNDIHNEIHATLAHIQLQKTKAKQSLIDKTAIIDPSARISDYGVTVGPRCYLGPNVYLGPGVALVSDCVLHAGAVLGMPGFNAGVIGGRQKIIPPVGGVKLMPFVELLSNVCIARATYQGDTIVGEESVLDNLVYIAHDVQIGRRVQICALVNILGRTIVGDEAYIGPSAVIKNGLKIGNRAKISIGSVVTQDVTAGETVTGNFAVAHDRFIGHMRSIR
jgi:UDP-3-O-[3-hydroxymyristoyl] glucosamine N-acyltransferase